MTLGDGLYAYFSSVLSVVIGYFHHPPRRERSCLPSYTRRSAARARSTATAMATTVQRRRWRPTSAAGSSSWPPADSARAAELLGAEVELAVDGYTGAWGGVPIASALVDLSLDDYRPDVGRYRRIVDVLVQWTRTS